MEQQNPASFSALEHSALKHSMCLLLKQKNAVRNSSSQRLHTFIIFHLCHSLSNIFVQYSSILFIYSLHSHSSHGFTASTCLYRLRNLCSLPSTKALWELRTAGSQNSVTCVNPMQYGHFPESENIRNRINPMWKSWVSHGIYFLSGWCQEDCVTMWGDWFRNLGQLSILFNTLVK
jgi:hypothetical protein